MQPKASLTLPDEYNADSRVGSQSLIQAIVSRFDDVIHSPSQNMAEAGLRNRSVGLFSYSQCYLLLFWGWTADSMRESSFGDGPLPFTRVEPRQPLDIKLGTVIPFSHGRVRPKLL